MGDYSVFKLNFGLKLVSMAATFAGVFSTSYWIYEYARVAYIKTKRDTKTPEESTS